MMVEPRLVSDSIVTVVFVSWVSWMLVESLVSHSNDRLSVVTSFPESSNAFTVRVCCSPGPLKVTAAGVTCRCTAVLGLVVPTVIWADALVFGLAMLVAVRV